MLLFGTGDAGGKPEPRAVVMTPGKDQPTTVFKVAMGTAPFVEAGDLNGDGRTEMLFGNYDLRFLVYGEALREVDVDGQHMDFAGRVQKKGAAVYINPKMFSLCRVSAKGKLAGLQCPVGEFVFDTEGKKVTRRAPEQEEFEAVSLPFIWTGKDLYVEIGAAARVFRFGYEWDGLNATLRIKTESKEWKSTWPKTH